MSSPKRHLTASEKARLMGRFEGAMSSQAKQTQSLEEFHAEILACVKDEWRGPLESVLWNFARTYANQRLREAAQECERAVKCPEAQDCHITAADIILSMIEGEQ